MSFKNHFLILILLNTILRQCFKDRNIVQRAYRLIRLRTLTFTLKKSNGIFFPTEFFLSLSPVVLYDKAKGQCIQCQIAAETISMSFLNVTVFSFKQQCVFGILV